VLLLIARLPSRASVAAMLVVAPLMAADLALNNGPNESTALPPKGFDVLDPATRNETILLLKRLMTHPLPSDRRDRVELAGVGFLWPNAPMIHGFDHTLGYNPLRLADVSDATGARDYIAGPDQRTFSPLFPSYRSLLADIMGLRYIVSSVPIGRVDANLQPGDLRFLAHTPDGYVYENPRALPRVVFATNWLAADFDWLIETGNWPDFDPRRTVLLEAEQGAVPPLPSQRVRVPARGCAPRPLREHRGRDRCRLRLRRLRRAQRRVASVVGCDRRRQASRTSCRRTCCSAPSRLRPAAIACASSSSRSKAPSPSLRNACSRADAARERPRHSGDASARIRRCHGGLPCQEATWQEIAG
jgi:hypothetical protein